MTLFKKNDRVYHVKSGNTYTIDGTPDTHRLESNGDPCYTYCGSDSIVWVRSQKEMEDGRFVKAT